MAPPKIRPLTGPLTPLAVTKWVSHCETEFEIWEEYKGRIFTERNKIRAAGNAILDQGFTQDLFKWWTSSEEELSSGGVSWQQFQGLLKTEALGKEWILTVIQEFYTMTQGDMSTKEYIEKCKNLSFVISRIGADVSRVDQFVESCLLLFKASPDALDHIFDLGFGTSVAKLSPGLVGSYLEKYHGDRTRMAFQDPGTPKVEEESSSSGVLTPTQCGCETEQDSSEANGPTVSSAGYNTCSIPSSLDGDTALYLLTASCSLKGRDLNGGWDSFNDLYYLAKKFPLPKVKRLSIWHEPGQPITTTELTNQAFPTPELGLKTYEFGHTAGISWGPSIHNKTSAVCLSLTLEGGEYIKSVRFNLQVVLTLKGATSSEEQSGITDMLVSTSRGNALHFGRMHDTWQYNTVAPDGWSIIGFHGAQWHGIVPSRESYGCTSIASLGCIFSPIY
ncbi:hypothetical protein ABW20_dc0106373 [Dactylellina cionopaga]|nr:hypothetical protein ABW20_dc0106373 [Dactylellina cionopaga]